MFRKPEQDRKQFTKYKQRLLAQLSHTFNFYLMMFRIIMKNGSQCLQQGIELLKQPIKSTTDCTSSTMQE